MIYFDFNKYDIRPDAALDLSKIVDMMKEYPNMQVSIRTHTDSRGSKKYNERLSDNRAKSIMKWMTQQGIEAKRLIAKGYGESQLINKCADTVECTEEEHQLNRRSEFLIIQL